MPFPRTGGEGQGFLADLALHAQPAVAVELLAHLLHQGEAGADVKVVLQTLELWLTSLPQHKLLERLVLYFFCWFTRPITLFNGPISNPGCGTGG